MATSYGRNVQLESDKQTALDEHPGVKEYFDQARTGELEQAQEQDNQQVSGRDSQMVADAAPRPELRPSYDLEGAKDADRENFDERWAKEQADAAEYQSLYEESQEAEAEQDSADLDAADDYGQSL